MQDMPGKKREQGGRWRRLAKRSVLPVLLAEIGFTLLCLGVGGWVWRNDYDNQIQEYRQEQFETFRLQSRLLDQRLADQQQYLRQLGYATRRLFQGEGPPSAVTFASPLSGASPLPQPADNGMLDPALTASEREDDTLTRQIHWLEPLMSDLYQSDALIQRLYIVLPQGVAAVLPGSGSDVTHAMPELETHWLGTGELPPDVPLPWLSEEDSGVVPKVELRFNIFETDRQALLGVKLDENRLLRLMQDYVRTSRHVWLVNPRGDVLVGNALVALPDDAGQRGMRALPGAQKEAGLLAWVTLPTVGWRLVGELSDSPPPWALPSLGWVVLIWAAGSLMMFFMLQLQSRYRRQRWEGDMRVPMERMARIRQRLEAEAPVGSAVRENVGGAGGALGSASLARFEHSLDSLEEASQRLEKRPHLPALLDALGVPAALAHDGLLTSVNTAFEQLVGRPRAELLGVASEGVILTGDGRGEPHVRVRDGSGHWRSLRVIRGGDGQGYELTLLIDESDNLYRMQQLTQARNRARQESQLKSRYMKMLRGEFESLALQMRQQNVDVGERFRERFWGLMEVLDSLSDAPQATAPNIAGDRTPTSASPSPPRVLIVDDGPVNTALAHNVLSQQGLNVDTAGSGEEALALADRHFYDLVFMDIFMPAPDGIETSRRWRERESQGAGQRSILIALSANASEAYREQFIAVGMDDYLAKPYRPQALIDMIHRWLPDALPEPT